MVNKKKVDRKNKGSAARHTTGTAFYIFFGIVYLIIIWVLHIFAPFYHKYNDIWNDRAFSEPLEGELFPGNIILIDIDSWPYYKDNRDEAKQARDKVVNGMIEIIDLLNRDPKKKPPFIGIDMTFESYASSKIMEQLFKRVEVNQNIYLSVEFDRKLKKLIFPGNDFWKRVNRNIGKIKERLMVINLEKYSDEPVRRYRTFYNGTFDNTGKEYRFPSMGVVIAGMVNRHFLGNRDSLNVTGRASRFRYRYLIRDIKEDYRKYNVFPMRSAKRKFEEIGMGADFSGSIVIFGRMDPDPGGRDRFPVCASFGKGNKGVPVSLPGVMIHVNVAQSILLGESIAEMGMWSVLGYLVVLLLLLILLHVILEALVKRWKSGWSHWYAEIFLFFAFGFFIIFLDNLLREPGNHNLEIPMFTFYMFVVKFYPVLGACKWIYRRVVLRESKKSFKKSEEESKNAKG
jgi:hypothetical protein